MDLSTWSADRWMAFVFFVLGLGATYVFYKKAHKESKPQYRSTLIRLIGPYDRNSPFTQTDVALKIKYGDREAESVSKIYLTLWNAGRETLDMQKSKIDAEKVKIVLPAGCEFWGIPRVLKQTRESLNFTATITPESSRVAEIDFDFLNHKDGAILEFLCTGPAEKYNVTGNFKYSRSLKRRGKLLLGIDQSYRDRWIGTAAELFGIRRWWKLENISVFLLILLLSFTVAVDTNVLAGILFALITVCALVSLVAFATVTPYTGPGKAQSGSLFGVPQKLCKIPLGDHAMSQSDKGVRQFFKSLFMELSGRT